MHLHFGFPFGYPIKDLLRTMCFNMVPVLLARESQSSTLWRTPTYHPTPTIWKHTMPRSEPRLLVMCFHMVPFQATIRNLIFKELLISQCMCTLYTGILYLSNVFGVTEESRTPTEQNHNLWHYHYATVTIVWHHQKDSNLRLPRS